MRLRIRQALLGVSLCAVASSAAQGLLAQAVGSEKGQRPLVVIGRVIDGVTGRPVSDARVWLEPAAPELSVSEFVRIPLSSAPPSSATLTAADGRFVLGPSLPGRYAVVASLHGYSRGAYGQGRSGGPVGYLTIERGTESGAITLRLWPTASLSGVVIDERGDLAVAVEVRCFEEVFAGGRRRLSVAATTTTDDRGAYRVANLNAGRYVCGVTSQATTMPAVQSLGADDRRRLQESGAAIDLGFAAGLKLGAHYLNVLGLMRGWPSPAPDADGTLRLYAPTFFPGVTTPADASPITLTAGEHRFGVDLALTLEPTTAVTGVVLGPDGPVPYVGVTLVPSFGSHFVSEGAATAGRTVTTGDGRFTFLGVLPGAYFVKVRLFPRPNASSANLESARPPDLLQQLGVVGGVRSQEILPSQIPDASLWANAEVSVNAKAVETVVSLLPGIRITGRVAFSSQSGDLSPDAIRRIAVRLQSAEGRTSSPVPADGRVDDNLGFSTGGVASGRYIVSVSPSSLPDGWYLLHARWRDQDISTDPVTLADEDIEGVVITLSKGSSTLSGVVSDQGTRRAGLVFVFPADSTTWRQSGPVARRSRVLVSAEDGTFLIEALPPGEYFVAGRPLDYSAEIRDPATLGVLQVSASRVRVEEGTAAYVDVSIPKGGTRE